VSAVIYLMLLGWKKHTGGSTTTVA